MSSKENFKIGDSVVNIYNGNVFKIKFLYNTYCLVISENRRYYHYNYTELINSKKDSKEQKVKKIINKIENRHLNKLVRRSI